MKNITAAVPTYTMTSVSRFAAKTLRQMAQQTPPEPPPPFFKSAVKLWNCEIPALSR